jgi:hypothetical protein
MHKHQTRGRRPRPVVDRCAPGEKTASPASPRSIGRAPGPADVHHQRRPALPEHAGAQPHQPAAAAVDELTPSSIVAMLRRGFPPHVHPSPDTA